MPYCPVLGGRGTAVKFIGYIIKGRFVPLATDRKLYSKKMVIRLNKARKVISHVTTGY